MFFENSDVPSEDIKRAMKILKPVLDWRVKKTKWCVLRWPSPSMAQQAKRVLRHLRTSTLMLVAWITRGWPKECLS